MDVLLAVRVQPKYFVYPSKSLLIRVGGFLVWDQGCCRKGRNH